MTPHRWLPLMAAGCGVLATAMVALSAPVVPTPRRVTNTTSGKNQNPSIDKKGNLIVFQSNVNHTGGVTAPGTGTFDFDNMGNDFTLPAAVPPDPGCASCDLIDAGDGQLFLWRKNAFGVEPANSVRQLTFSVGGGFAANQFPDVNQLSSVIAWDSDRDHLATNADGNREIFVYEIATATTTQLTATTGGADTANRFVNWSDDGTLLVFDSTRDFNGVLGCTLTDGATACDNADGNAEVMLWDRGANTLTQITQTTTDGANANLRARISSEGAFVAFQSTRDFSGALPGGATCTLADAITPCANDGNGEVMLYDRALNAFIQVTNTVNGSGCTGANPNERVEVSKKGRFVTWQSKCEAQLNAAGCGTCDGNDEIFVFDLKNGTTTQLTISQGGFSRVPRIAGKGKWIIFESNRNYKNLNLGQSRTLFILKRNTSPGSGGFTGPGQLLADPGSLLVQNARTNVVPINFGGGFNSTVEQFGASSNGRFFAFDNKKGVGNQEVWFLDRKK